MPHVHVAIQHQEITSYINKLRVAQANQYELKAALSELRNLPLYALITIRAPKLSYDVNATPRLLNTRAVKIIALLRTLKQPIYTISMHVQSQSAHLRHNMFKPSRDIQASHHELNQPLEHLTLLQNGDDSLNHSAHV